MLGTNHLSFYTDTYKNNTIIKLIVYKDTNDKIENYQ